MTLQAAAVARRGAATEHPAPDLANLVEEAQALTAHAEFDDAMRAFCRNLTDFHARSRRVGIVDTITWSIAVFVIHCDATEPGGGQCEPAGRGMPRGRIVRRGGGAQRDRRAHP